MNKIKSSKICRCLILSAMILVLTVIYILIGAEKSYIHMDEAYSLGLSNYHRVELVDDEGFFDTWHDGAYYNDYLIVNEDESGDFAPVYNNQRDDVHPPLYYLFLRLFMEGSVGKFSMWPGLILNILLQIPAVILLYLICRRLFENIYAAYAVTFLSSVSVAAVCSVTYIRMYAMAGVMILLTLWLHLLLDEREKIYPLLPAVGAAAVCGSLTHYYYLFFLGALFVLFTVKFARRKRWRELAAYIGTLCAAAGISLAIFPYSINHLFFGYRGQGAMENLTKITGILWNIGVYILKTEQNIFNCTLFVILALCIVFFIYGHMQGKPSMKLSSAAHIVWIPTAFYFFVVAAASPYTELRYVMPVCTLITALGAYFLCGIITSAGSKKIVCTILSVILSAYLILPAAIGIEPETLYTRRRPIIEDLSGEYNLPTVYCFNMGCQRFLDDIYLFTLLDESYIAKDPDYTEETFRAIFDGKDTSRGVVVFINEWQDDHMILNTVKDALGLNWYFEMTELNACKVYCVK